MVTRFPDGLALGRDLTGIAGAPGRPKVNTLRVASDVVAAQTVVIGPDTYRVAVVNTDSTKETAGGKINNTEKYVSFFPMTAHGRIEGDLIRVENEIMQVLGKPPDANHLHLLRGVSGTTIAAHADATAIYTEAASGGGGIGVGLVTTLTPTAFTAALVADINNRGSAPVKATLLSANYVLVANADKPGGSYISGGPAFSTTETLAGANNAWAAVALGGGAGAHFVDVIAYTPSAAEVTAGTINIPLTYDATVLKVLCIQDVFTICAWDGDAVIADRVLTIDNSGDTDWSATDTLYIFLQGA